MNSTHCNNVIRHAMAIKFSRVFALSLTPYFTNTSGLDSGALGKTLFGHTEALEEHVLNRYGAEGVSIVRKLACVEPLSDDEKDIASAALGRYYVASVSGYHESRMISL